MPDKTALIACDAIPQGTAIAMFEGVPVYVGACGAVPSQAIDEMFLNPEDMEWVRTILKDRLGDEISDAMFVCNEVYQVIAVLADMADVFDDPAVTAVLDNLADAANGKALSHETLLPFSPTGGSGKIEHISEIEVEAAAAWLREDDTAYETDPDNGKRAARAMLGAAKLARWGRNNA